MGLAALLLDFGDAANKSIYLNIFGIVAKLLLLQDLLLLLFILILLSDVILLLFGQLNPLIKFLYGRLELISTIGCLALVYPFESVLQLLDLLPHSLVFAADLVILLIVFLVAVDAIDVVLVHVLQFT